MVILKQWEGCGRGGGGVKSEINKVGGGNRVVAHTRARAGQ